MKTRLTILLLSCFLLCSCGGVEEPGEGPAPTHTTPVYQKVTSERANEIMLEYDSYILLDVRTAEEYSQLRIDGAILIPDYELEERAETELPDKESLILLYCRTGNRSKAAAETLVSMGYTNVYDFGGIEQWPYGTVSD